MATFKGTSLFFCQAIFLSAICDNTMGKPFLPSPFQGINDVINPYAPTIFFSSLQVLPNVPQAHLDPASPRKHVPETNHYAYLTFASRNYKDFLGGVFDEPPFNRLQEVPMQEDVIVVQNVRIPEKDWEGKANGALEFFGPIGFFNRILLLKSGEKQYFPDKGAFRHSFGLSISGSIGLNITDYGSIDKNTSTEIYGAVYVLGEINQEKVMFCAIHGDWTNSEDQNENNVDILRQVFKKGKGYKIVVLGTFFMGYDFVKGQQNEFQFEMEKGPLLSSDKNRSLNDFGTAKVGDESIDHVLVNNCNIVQQPTVVSAGYNRGWLSNIIVNIKKYFKITKLPLKIKTTNELKFYI